MEKTLVPLICKCSLKVFLLPPPAPPPPLNTRKKQAKTVLVRLITYNRGLCGSKQIFEKEGTVTLNVSRKHLFNLYKHRKVLYTHHFIYQIETDIKQIKTERPYSYCCFALQ